MCLVINKIDRLILELELSPNEAYTRIAAIVSHVNMIISSFESEKFISEADAVLAHENMIANSNENVVDASGEESDYFVPENGNVAFGSAYDGWAFTVQEFAELYAKKLECNPKPLHKALWGNYMFNRKTKRIVPIKSGHSGTPLFVQWILDPIWRLYDSCRTGSNHVDMLSNLVAKLDMSSNAVKLSKHQDPKVALKGVMRSWIPLSDAILGMGHRCLPDPRTASPNRMSRLLPRRKGSIDINDNYTDRMDTVGSIERSISECRSSKEAPLVIYVSKMVSVPRNLLPRKPGEYYDHTQSSDEVFLAFGRVFSGVAQKGAKVKILQADYDPTESSSDNNTSISDGCLSELYLMMGRGLESLDLVPAGNTLAIAGLETLILKSATISSTQLCRPLAPLLFQATPIVQVAVEPALPSDMDALEKGLQLLHRADPLVKVKLQESGEHIVSAAGEVHLETCIKDLKERFAKVDLIVSAPLVSFQESVAIDELPPKVIESHTAGKGCTIRVRVTPMEDNLCSEIDSLQDSVSSFVSNLKTEDTISSNEHFIVQLKDKIKSSKFSPGVSTLCSRIWMLGPKRCGPNFLLASSGKECSEYSIWDVGGENVVELHPIETKANDTDTEEDLDVSAIDIALGLPIFSRALGLCDDNKAWDHEETIAARIDPEIPPEVSTSLASAIHSVSSGVATGFQLASGAGPLCDEPLRGLVVEIVARLNVKNVRSTPELLLQEDVFGPFNGQVSAVVRQAIRKAVLENRPRLVEAYFLCEVSTSSEGLSAVYAVLGKRRAKVLREELREGSGLFAILAHLPVEGSFGFADELRRKSSGNASASLMLSHWDRLSMDPFFKPLTEEEREEFGEEGQGVGAPNLAKKLIDVVRRRKGLAVEEKVVESATKQRTRARKV